jgi:hypothetical protein
MPAKKRKTAKRTSATRKPSARGGAGVARRERKPSLFALTSQGFGTLRERAKGTDRLSAALERLQADYERVLKRRR